LPRTPIARRGRPTSKGGGRREGKRRERIEEGKGRKWREEM